MTGAMYGSQYIRLVSSEGFGRASLLKGGYMSQLRRGLPSLIDCKLHTEQPVGCSSPVGCLPLGAGLLVTTQTIVSAIGCAAAALHYINVALPRSTEGHDLIVWRLG
jgi:hypothetical protein